MEYGLLLLISLVLGGGISGAIVSTWSIRTRLYSLEVAQATLERSHLQEVKRRAAGERWKPKPEDELLSALVDKKDVAPMRPKTWFDDYIHPDLKR